MIMEYHHNLRILGVTISEMSVIYGDGQLLQMHQFQGATLRTHIMLVHIVLSEKLEEQDLSVLFTKHLNKIMLKN